MIGADPWGGGGGGSPLNGLHRDVPLDRVCFTSPPCPPRGADMLDMTTDAQEGNNNFTRPNKHNAMTQCRHAF